MQHVSNMFNLICHMKGGILIRILMGSNIVLNIFRSGQLINQLLRWIRRWHRHVKKTKLTVAVQKEETIK